MQLPTMGAIRVRGGLHRCRPGDGLLLRLAGIIPPSFDLLTVISPNAGCFSFLLLHLLLLPCFVGGVVDRPGDCGSAGGVLAVAGVHRFLNGYDEITRIVVATKMHSGNMVL